MGDDFRMGAESCRWISMQTVAPLYDFLLKFSSGNPVPCMHENYSTLLIRH